MLIKDYHIERSPLTGASVVLFMVLVMVVILVFLAAMVAVKPTWEAHSQLPVEAEKRSPVRGNKQSYSSALLLTGFICDVE